MASAPHILTELPRRAGHAAERTAERAAGQTHSLASGSWVTQLARVGYATRGFLYVMIGLLALEAAIGAGGKTTGTKGAVAAVAELPLGRFLMALVTFGLIAYTIWAAARASVRPKQSHSTWNSVGRRLGYVSSFLWYGSLIPFSVALTLGQQADASNNGRTQMVGRILQHGIGRPVLLTLGGLCLAFAAWQAYEAASASFRKDFKHGELSHDQYTWVVRIGRAGYAARGIAYAIIGWFVIHGALDRNPEEIRTTDGVLQMLQSQPHGALLLGIMAAGLIAFGLYSLTFSKCATARSL